VQRDILKKVLISILSISFAATAVFAATPTFTMTASPTVSPTIGPDWIYDGDTVGIRLQDGITAVSAPGNITEQAVGNPGNAMQISYVAPNWWQQQDWQLPAFVNEGPYNEIVFDIRQDPSSPNPVMHVQLRIDWPSPYPYISDYLGQEPDTTWRTVRMPLETLLASGATGFNFLSFSDNWNTDYTVDVDNVRLEYRYHTPTFTCTISPTSSVTPTVNLSNTATLTYTVSPTFTITPTVTPSFTATQTPTAATLSVLYREVFPNDTGANILFSTAGWYNHEGATGVLKTTNNGVSLNEGRPPDENAINSFPMGPEMRYGFASNWGAAVIEFIWTDEFTVDRANYQVSQIRWYQGNASATTAMSAAVRIGGAWYVSNQAFTNAAMTAGQFQPMQRRRYLILIRPHGAT